MVLDTGTHHAVGRLVHDGPLIRAESARPTSPNQTSGQLREGGLADRLAQDYVRDGDFTTPIRADRTQIRCGVCASGYNPRHL